MRARLVIACATIALVLAILTAAMVKASITVVVYVLTAVQNGA